MGALLPNDVTLGSLTKLTTRWGQGRHHRFTHTRQCTRRAAAAQAAAPKERVPPASSTEYSAAKQLWVQKVYFLIQKCHNSMRHQK